MSTASRRGVRNVVLTQRQTEAVADILAVVAGYQQAATGFADDTNAALIRVLRALRRTNEEFP